MPIVRPGNPYAVNYAYPKHVLGEGRFAVTTPWAPRGTIDDAVGHGIFAGANWAIPAYAREPQGSNPQVTPWAPRGWKDDLPQKVFLNPKATPKSVFPAHATPADPVVQFGVESAEGIWDAISDIDNIDERKKALHAILDGIDTGLWTVVADKASKLAPKYGAKRALKKALAAAMSNQLIDETMRLGGKSPTRAGLLGLGAFDDPDFYRRAAGLLNADLYPPGYDSLGWWGGDLYRDAKSAVKKAYSKTKSGLKTAYSKTKAAVKKAGSYIKKALCKISNSGTAQFAAQAGGLAAGGAGGAQAAGQGMALAQNYCGGGSSAAPQNLPAQPLAPAPKDNTMLYLGLAGAGVLVLVLATR